MTRLPAVPVYLATEAVGSAAFMATFAVTNVYFVAEVGMSPLQLVLCGTAMELAIFVFEVPTGVIADTVSRRLSVIVSFFVLGVAMTLFGVLGSAPLIIAAYALWGFGYTFQSGAYEAWLADEVGEERLTRALLRGAQAGNLGGLLGIGLGTVLALVDLRLAIVAGGALVLSVGGFLAVVMPETGFRPERAPDAGTGPRAFLGTARAGASLVRGHHLLLLVLAIAFFWGMWTESFDRLWQAQFLTEVGLPSGALPAVGWIGLLTAAAMVIAIVVAQLAVPRLEGASRERLARVLLGANGAILVGALAFAVAGAPWLAMVAYAAVVACRALIVPLQSAWVNRTIERPAVRATVLSIVSQADAVGQVGGGPAIGAIGSSVGLRPALAVGAGALAPALALYARVVRRHGHEPELESLQVASSAQDR
jgi:MFS transporter, DHA3 family, tetracycline resistance protein